MYHFTKHDIVKILSYCKDPIFKLPSSNLKKEIILTRSVESQNHWLSELTGHGFNVLEMPLIHQNPVYPDQKDLKKLFAIENFNLLFSSLNAVKFCFGNPVLSKHFLNSKSIKNLLTIGTRSKLALESLFSCKKITFLDSFDLINRSDSDILNKNLIWVCSEYPLENLDHFFTQNLSEKYFQLKVYKTKNRTIDARAFYDAALRRKAAIVIASPSALHSLNNNLTQLESKEVNEVKNRSLLFVLGKQSLDTAKKAGFKKVKMGERPNFKSLLKIIISEG